MDEAERFSLVALQLVSGVKTLPDLHHDPRGEMRGEDSFGVRARRSEDACERDAIDELHDDVRDVVELTELQRRDDVSMMELRSEPRLGEKRGPLARRRDGTQRLQRDEAIDAVCA